MVEFRKLSQIALLTLLVSFAVAAWAQKDTGGIAGTVKDASGALVSGAKVTITDVDRGGKVETTSSGQGEFLLTPLKVGRYNIAVEKTGFKKAVAGPVQVDVQERLAVNFILQVGSQAEIVVVTAEAPLLETQNSDLGQVVDARRVNTLPLNGRNFAQLALLGAGIAPSEPGSRVQTSYGFSSNGARSLQNNFLLDGVDNNANLGDVLNGSAFVIQPSVDAIGEFKVQTNAYSAEFGRGNGAILNAVIKSGANQFHGDVYEFFRNEKLDARNAFDQFGRQPYKQNQFGFTLGGPIIKDRTFFFGDYEGLRVRQALPQLVLIPTPAMVGGDFSSFLPSALNSTTAIAGVPDCSGNPTYPGEIFNTRLTQTSSSGTCGVPIAVDGSGNPTNIFPSNLIDPLAARLSALFPTPNANISGSNFLSEPKRQESRNNFDIRIDHKISDKNDLFGRFSYEDQPSVIPSPFNNVLDGGNFADGIEDDSYRSLALSDTHAFNPTLVNELRFGYNRINSHRFQLNYNQNVAAQLDFPGIPFGPRNGGLPNLTFSDGITSIGSSTFLPSVEKQNSYVFNENLTWIRGRHSMKYGTEIRREQFTIFQPAASRGTMGFGSEFTDNPAAPGSGGDAFASFLLGIPDFGQITSLHNVDYHRQIYAVYGLDDIKVTPRLTLNLGLRYELFTTIKEAHDQESTFDFASKSLIVPKGQNAQLTPFLAANIPIQRNGSRGLIKPDLNNFAPRIGLAYQITQKLVLRSGYGIFYGGQENGPFSNPSPGFNPPFFVTQSYNPPCGASSANTSQLDCSIPNLNVLAQGFPATALVDPNTPILYSIDPRLRTPYAQQWHLGVQYQLPSNTVFEIAYAGSRGLKLFTFFNGNQAVPATDPRFVADCLALGTLQSCPTAFRRPASGCNFSVAPPDCSSPAAGIFDTIINTFRSNGFSNYHSLQARLEKRTTHGLQFQFSYTYSHALDDASSASLGSTNNGDFRDQRFPRLEYGNSDFDVRHRFVASYIYDLPLGSGKRFGGGASGITNQLIGNWQLAGIVTASTGNYYTVSDTTPSLTFATVDCGGTVAFNCTLPNVIANPNGKPCPVPQGSTLFNTCAFMTDMVVGTYGNERRNQVPGPGLQSWDLSLFKNLPIREQMRVEFRAEFFNVWNHVNPLFNHIGAISEEPTPLELGTPQFGQAISARDPRFIQLALKFYF
jgi:hypothetical protein